MLQLKLVLGLCHSLIFLWPMSYDILLPHIPSAKPSYLHQLYIDMWQIYVVYSGPHP